MASLLQLKDRFTGRDLVVVIFHDHGSGISGRCSTTSGCAKGFLEKSGMTAASLVASGLSGELCAIEAREPVEKAVQLMREHDFSQISIPTTSACGIAQRNASLFRPRHGPGGEEPAGRGRSCSWPSHSWTSRRTSSCLPP
jgi:hypothetical protein